MTNFEKLANINYLARKCILIPWHLVTGLSNESIQMAVVNTGMKWLQTSV